MEEAEEDEEVEVAADAGGSGDKPSKDTLKVFVGGIPYSWGKDELRTLFAECGEIDWLHMPRDMQGQPRGIAFISYWSMESVEEALKLDGREFEGRPMKVNMAAEKPVKLVPPKKERDVFVGGLPYQATAEVVKKDFAECGKISKFEMPLQKAGTSKGVAFVTYKTAAGAAEALKFNGTDYGGRTLTVRMASDKTLLQERKSQPKGKGRGKGEGKAKSVKDVHPEPPEPSVLEVIVRGLGPKAAEDALRAHLKECGEVESVRIPMNKKKRFKGFAFVRFETKKGVKKALKLSGTQLDGKTIEVERLIQPEGAEAQADVAEDQAAADDSSKKKKRREEVADVEVDAADPESEVVEKKKKRKAADAENEVTNGEGDKEERRKKRKEAAAMKVADDDDGDDDDEQEYTKEEIVERTKANRERRKAAKAALQKST
eukprot:gnl/TRDRNA2_/TRDRNA2_61343_c0_seq1.p1 gnl/TRDRNA2_/TRDRNA2_61343_c0~~gnl/TRDRNA2_/TRDRNA2_61343_c0_seq1.p1  ORF type:complete len:442 (-),score=148.63 gnl/TRDRNA2_/TRDRNA2_61343_c0_seq1:168-1460(-)